MNPFSKTITFSNKKPNYFYCVKEDNKYFTVPYPQIGDIVYEVPIVAGGEEKKIFLEIPIPLCKKHQHGEIPFGVKTCTGWQYIIIPTILGSLKCRECDNELFISQPYLSSANLNSANLNSANLNFADLSSANLRSANLRSADLCSANLNSANLNSANLNSANLNSANLGFADLSSADLRFADLSSADLRFANLNFADLSSADLSSADLRSADLRSADLRSADLRSADLRSADLSSANNIDKLVNIDKAYWNKFTRIDNKFKVLLNKNTYLVH